MHIFLKTLTELYKRVPEKRAVRERLTALPYQRPSLLSLYAKKKRKLNTSRWILRYVN